MFCILTTTTSTIHNKLRIQEQAYTDTTTNNNNLIQPHNRCQKRANKITLT